MLGCRYVGTDLDRAYCAVARRRLLQPDGSSLGYARSHLPNVPCGSRIRNKGYCRKSVGEAANLNVAESLVFARHLITNQLDRWVNQLAAPLMPPRMVPEGDDLIRLEFRHHTPHSVMVGKSIRAVSGIRAALVLADLGYVTECGALLRIVSDFCSEVIAIGHALNRGGELPPAVLRFVEQYFAPKSRTPEQLVANERVRYVSRDELMKAGRPAADANVDGEHLRVLHRFLNMTYDAYVHGAYETTMELCDPLTGRFMTGGHPDASKREGFVDAVALKLHEVIVALEFTAATTAHADVFTAARNARHAMDAADLWRYSD